jgi:hypothetical protein
VAAGKAKLRSRVQDAVYELKLRSTLAGSFPNPASFQLPLAEFKMGLTKRLLKAYGAIPIALSTPPRANAAISSSGKPVARTEKNLTKTQISSIGSSTIHKRRSRQNAPFETRRHPPRRPNHTKLSQRFSLPCRNKEVSEKRSVNAGVKVR